MDNSEVIGVFPTSPAQTFFWYQAKSSSDPRSGNIAVRWEIRGGFNDESIEKAVQTVVDRHEVLRTRFSERDGLLHQEIVERIDFRMGVVDIHGLPDHKRGSRIDDIADLQSSSPFDLGAACLIRITLVRSASDCASLLITAHHTIFDGFSIRVLGKEIGTAAAAFEEGRPLSLPDLKLQYADYSLWQKELQAGTARAENAAYWKSQLQDAQYFEVEPDSPTTARSVRSGQRVGIAFPDDFGDKLAAFAREHNTSPFVLGAAVAAEALHKFTGQSDVSFGTALVGRDEIELEDLIGVFINPIVLRFRTAGSGSFTDVIARAGKVVQGALAHGEYPFADLVSSLKRPRDINRTPLVSVFFGLQRVFLEEQSYGPLSIASVLSKAPQITHDLNIQVSGRASGWRLIIDYDSARFEESTVTTLIHLFRDVFLTVLADPSKRIDDVPFAGRAKFDVVQSKNLSPAIPFNRNTPPALRIVETAQSHEAREDQSELDRLTAIWAVILGLPADSCDGDFFDLGGHSLLVLRMLARVEDQFNIRVPLIEFLENPTLKGVFSSIQNVLAEISADAAGSNWEVITLRNGLPDAPVIVSINQPFLYHNISRKFDERYRVLNLHIANERYFDLENATPLKKIISDAVNKIRTETAGRPVVVMGQCVDGLLGLAIVQSLEKDGHDVLNLAMVDSWAPNSSSHLTSRTKRRRRLQSKLRRWRQYLRLKMQGEISWTEFLSKSSTTKKLLIALGRLDPPTNTELQERRINAHLMNLFHGHQFARYAGEVVLFRTESQTIEAITRGFGWDGILGPDTPVFPLRGWHEDTLLWSGFDKISDIIECRLKRYEQGFGPNIAPQKQYSTAEQKPV